MHVISTQLNDKCTQDRELPKYPIPKIYPTQKDWRVFRSLSHSSKIKNIIKGNIHAKYKSIKQNFAKLPIIMGVIYLTIPIIYIQIAQLKSL